MEYDQLIWILMFSSIFITLPLGLSRLPVLILLSNAIYLVFNNHLDGTPYYIAEGFRHILTVVGIGYLYFKERHCYLYGAYMLLYIVIMIHFLCGLYRILSNADMDYIGIMLNTLEVVVFLYGFAFKNNNYDSFDRQC